MIKRYMRIDMLMLMLLSTNISAKGPKLNGPKPEKPVANMAGEFLSHEEIAIIEQNPDRFYVYLDKDAVNFFNSIKVDGQMPEALSILLEHIKVNKVVDYDFLCNAVEEALKCCKDKEHLDMLMPYKAALESGDLVLSADPITRKCCSNKKCLNLCRLIVRHNAKVGSLTVVKDATVGGTLSVTGNGTFASDLAVTGSQTIGKNLSVGGNLTVLGDESLTGNLTVSGDESLTGNLTVNGNSTLVGATTIQGGNPVLDFSESISTIRATYQMTDLANLGFTVTANLSTTPGDPALIGFIPNSGIPLPTLLTGSGFTAPTGAVITPIGLDISNLTEAYCNNGSVRITNQDYIYINFSFPVLFTKPFASRPLVSVSMHNTNSSTLNNLVNPTVVSFTPQGASLHLIQAGPSAVTNTGCTINLLLGFNIGQFATAQKGTIDLTNLTNIVNDVVSNMGFDLTAMGNY